MTKFIPAMLLLAATVVAGAAIFITAGYASRRPGFELLGTKTGSRLAADYSVDPTRRLAPLSLAVIDKAAADEDASEGPSLSGLAPGLPISFTVSIDPPDSTSGANVQAEEPESEFPVTEPPGAAGETQVDNDSVTFATLPPTSTGSSFETEPAALPAATVSDNAALPDLPVVDDIVTITTDDSTTPESTDPPADVEKEAQPIDTDVSVDLGGQAAGGDTGVSAFGDVIIDLGAVSLGANIGPGVGNGNGNGSGGSSGNGNGSNGNSGNGNGSGSGGSNGNGSGSGSGSNGNNGNGSNGNNGSGGNGGGASVGIDGGGGLITTTGNGLGNVVNGVGKSLGLAK